MGDTPTDNWLLTAYERKGKSASASSHIASKSAIMKKLQGMERAYTKESLLPNSSEWHLAEHPSDVPDLLPTQGKSEISESKGTNSASDKQEKVEESLTQPTDNEGTQSVQAAIKAYFSNYAEGWRGMGAITEVSKEDFRKWIDSSKRKTKPFADYKIAQHPDPYVAKAAERGMMVWDAFEKGGDLSGVAPLQDDLKATKIKKNETFNNLSTQQMKDLYANIRDHVARLEGNSNDHVSQLEAGILRGVMRGMEKMAKRITNKKFSDAEAHGIKFSMKKPKRTEADNIVEQAKVNGTYLKAPNYIERRSSAG